MGKKQLSNLIDMKVSNALFDIKLGGITGNFKFLFREILKKQICIKVPIQWKLELFCQFFVSLFVLISGVFIAAVRKML